MVAHCGARCRRWDHVDGKSLGRHLVCVRFAVVDAHARDELGLDPNALVRPGQAAFASATAFALGALIPTITVSLAPAGFRTIALATTALVVLGALGAVGAKAGGGNRWRGALRVAAGGGVAMLITGLVGRAVHATGL